MYAILICTYSKQGESSMKLAREKNPPDNYVEIDVDFRSLRRQQKEITHKKFTLSVQEMK